VGYYKGGNMPLTLGQQEFFYLIEESSCSETIMRYFDLEKRQINIEFAKQSIGSLSHGEQIMLKFFAMVWLHRNELEFDFLEAAQTLDGDNREIISDWIKNPLWP
jgi:hypothetical protein